MASRRRPGREARLRPRYLAVAGFLLFFVGVAGFMGIITAEALYPAGYSTRENAISDLGATEPPNSVIEQPSATIFNTTMMACGALVVLAAFCVQRGSRRWVAPVLIAVFGIGAIGVGVFPGDHGNVHEVFALLTFTAGGLAAILSYTIETAPFSCLSVLLGVVTLVTLLLYAIMGDSSPQAAMGLGGVERWVAYPILLWVTGLGGHLMGRAR
jgi:hypothetical membrane protein